MIKVYINGCSTCGVNSAYIRKVKRYGESIGVQVEVFNSKYDEATRFRHANYLLYAGLPMGEYGPIVVEDEHVTKLREWDK